MYFAEFVFRHKILNGLMLYKPAVHTAINGNIKLDICSQCLSSLRKASIPKYALANKLYQGHLPAHFDDLTWVEETVCSCFCYTAHIT